MKASLAPSRSPVSTPCVTPSAPVFSGAISSSVPEIVLASGLNQPDDLLQDGSRLLIGEMGAGDIVELGPRGRKTLPGRVSGVEGMAIEGRVLYAANQPDDRVVAIAADGTLHTLLQLSSVPGVEGVDGIAAGGGQIVVPDAARGRVLWVRPDGTVVRTVTGFDRPAGDFVEAGGDVLVADENLGGVYDVRPDGTRTRLGGPLPEADDVVVDSHGAVYAVAVYVNGERLVKLVGGDWQTVASSPAWEPQGLAVDARGNPEVADPKSGRVYLFEVNGVPVASGCPRV